MDKQDEKLTDEILTIEYHLDEAIAWAHSDHPSSSDRSAAYLNIARFLLEKERHDSQMESIKAFKKNYEQGRPTLYTMSTDD